MNRLSIKMKLTLWYTVFMVLLFGAVFVSLYILTRHSVQTTTQNQVRNLVNEALKEIEYDDKGLEFEEDIGFFERGVYLIAYAGDNTQQILYGHMPARFQVEVELKLDTMQTMEIEGEQWYIYDNAMIVDGYGKVWIRGITSFSETQVIMSNILRGMGIVFPIIILLVAILGYWIIKKALSPMNKMISVAQGISAGGDLTRRIGLESKQKDEMYQLSKIFDAMFERLQDSFENEKQFIFDASHELKTPIAVIISYCEYLLSQDTVAGKEREDVQTILRQAQKMSRLIAQLLLLSKSEYTLQIEHINISDLVSIIVEEQQIFAEEKGITLHMDIAENLFVDADETMMIRVFINLIKNAITYGKTNGNVYVTIMETDSNLCGMIRDDGIGIKSEHLDKIWNRFYQVDTSRSTNGESEESSMGLGLSMVKWIVDAHKGSVKIKSEWGQGTEVSLLFHKKS